MCRHANDPSPGPHTGTLQWLKLLQHAALAVMKHEPGRCARRSRGANLSLPAFGTHLPFPKALPDPARPVPTPGSCFVTPGDKDRCLWDPGAAPSAFPSRCSKCPISPCLWKPTSLGWEKGNKMVVAFCWLCLLSFFFFSFFLFFLHKRLFSVEIKG